VSRHNFSPSLWIMAPTVRAATHKDIPQITKILNHYIDNTVITFRLSRIDDPTMLSTFDAIRADNLPFLVVSDSESEEGSDIILGYTYVTGYRTPSHMGYQHTTELSIFVHPSHIKSGVGSILMQRLLAILRNPEHESFSSYFEPTLPLPRVNEMLAVMSLDTDGPDGGYGLRDWYVKKWGFVQVGHLKKVGFKFGKWIDTLFCQLSLREV
jgi:L-amino acid N-acyltransferase YncA